MWREKKVLNQLDKWIPNPTWDYAKHVGGTKLSQPNMQGRLRLCHIEHFIQNTTLEQKRTN